MRDELNKQKDLITKAGGVVKVVYNHPRMTEITEGIQSLASVDFSQATATAEDVALGKTFYAGDSALKTGTASMADTSKINALFMYNGEEKTIEDEVYFTIPATQKKIRKYVFFENINNIRITFNDGLTEIDEYAFYATRNAKFYGFNELTTLIKVSNYAFTYSLGEGIDVARLPNSLETINSSAFAYVKPLSLDYRFPDNLKALGQTAFKQSYRAKVNSLDLSNYTLTSLPSYTFQNVGFNCDLILSSTIKSIGNYFNQNGSFNNITIPSTCTSLQNECFGANAVYAADAFRLQTVTFESETPPSFGNKVFAQQNVLNGFKIYVPDSAVEAYKAITNLQYCVDHIYPVSQKE